MTAFSRMVLPAALPAVMLVTTAFSREFVHPGMLHSRADLDRMKAMVARGREPWKGGWEKLLAAPVAGLGYAHHAVADLSVASGGAAGFGQQEDASAAHFQAVMWYVTGREEHARKAVEILNAWSYTLRTMGGSNARLQTGIAGYHFCNAAEILRHTYGGWAEADQARFRRMLLEIFYPAIQGFSDFNGNWTAYIILTMMSIGIFTDSAEIFDRAVDHFHNGDTRGSLRNYIYESGQCQESTRDQMHVQMGIGALAGACETGYHQGLDMYGAFGNRLLLGFEYTARYNLGHDVPAAGVLSPRQRGVFRPMWEIVHNHYVNRMGLDAPYVAEVVARQRPEGYNQDYISLGTLLFHSDPGSSGIAGRPRPALPALSVSRRGGRAFIRYTVTAPGPIRISAHSALGRETLELVRKVQGPGTYEIPWDGAGFLRLEPGLGRAGAAASRP